jgi:hypothetical protein
VDGPTKCTMLKNHYYFSHFNNLVKLSSEVQIYTSLIIHVQENVDHTLPFKCHGKTSLIPPYYNLFCNHKHIRNQNSQITEKQR